ncbi:MAG: response regulator [Geminicoccaceae bacterium]|nr:response regulator [Geminicoccaceae bacterium]
MSGPAHVLVVDDDLRLRGLLERYLRGHGYAVSTAADAEEAKGLLRGLSYDLLVLDVMLPGRSGVELTREIRRTGDLPILLLTALGEAQDRIGGLEAGADDYLSKPFEPRELLLRIEGLLRRARPAPAEPTERVAFGPFVFDLKSRELREGGRVVHLTGGEALMLACLARRPGQAMSRAELAEESRITGSDRAVDVQIVRLRRKIEDDPRQPRHLLTMRGEGYVLRTVR